MEAFKTDTIGILAGGGQFPRLVAESVKANGGRVVACGFEGHTDPKLAESVDAFTMLHIGQFNKTLAFFRRQKAQKLCMAGAINKPRALDLRPDLRAVRLIFSLRKKGDDALLRTLITEFENEGFTIIPPSDLLPSLRCPAGQLSKRPPNEEEWEDIRYGLPIALTIGRFDIGQCLVVKQGMVLAIECLEGTDMTLRRGSELGHSGCVALKISKPGQDERVDLPSIGLETIRSLIAGKYRCLAVEAGKTLFFDMQAALTLADQHNLAIVALNQEAMEKLIAPNAK